MSINTAHANGGVLIYNGEIILLYCDGVQLDVEGGGAKEFGGTKKGRIYLTTHRLIFLNKTEKDPLQSMSFPFFSLSGVELEQPVFGANYIKGNVNAQPGGFWTGKAVFKLKFFNGGAIDFGQAMVRAAKMAHQYMPPQPPPYMPHAGPYFPAPPPAYYPPQGGVGFQLPTQTFPDQPPANSVYTTNMPPPYPGIYPPAYPPAAGPQQGSAPQGGAPPAPGFSSDGGPSAPPPPYGQAGYPPQQQANGYPPQQQANGYPPQQQANGYPPQQAGYAPPPNGYPQQYLGHLQYYQQDPNNPNILYTQAQPGMPYANGMMHQEPPPPYFSDGSKKQN
ncbi:hypothetical protein JTE90_000335 [Oedothorax gibbosus]|uniref:GRAM domain-containing protein n=1 Tax=Oedothorax gibbosus TaxID=931172 RepID=A0AAV6U115_9ARAC|nr:hypothetical protein JTE90_000335 [Oedothorax gibbosus]